MNPTNQFPLVALSAAVAICASHAALTLAGRVRFTTVARYAWLASGSAALGIGLWSMEFVALLAARGETAIAFHLPFVAISVVAALVASSVALFLVSRPAVRVIHVSVAGIALGVSFVTMHYAGMAAIGASSFVTYDPALAGASAIIAIALSTTALWLFLWRRHDTSRRGRTVHAAAALGLAFAVVAMHYTATVAARITSADAVLVFTESNTLIASSLIAPVVIGSAACLASLLIALVIGERSRVRRATAVVAEPSFQANVSVSLTVSRSTARLTPRKRVRTILYVEDRPTELTLVQRMLAERQDIELITVRQGKPALELARMRRPDLVLLDVNVSDARREQALRDLQQIPGSRELPVVVVSDGASPEHVDRLLADGAHACVTRPLDVEPFIALLDRVLAVREAA